VGQNRKPRGVHKTSVETPINDVDDLRNSRAAFAHRVEDRLLAQLPVQNEGAHHLLRLLEPSPVAREEQFVLTRQQLLQ
jgi:hypothetical protein